MAASQNLRARINLPKGPYLPVPTLAQGLQQAGDSVLEGLRFAQCGYRGVVRRQLRICGAERRLELSKLRDILRHFELDSIDEKGGRPKPDGPSSPGGSAAGHLVAIALSRHQIAEERERGPGIVLVEE
jgi:hypothetical protein